MKLMADKLTPAKPITPAKAALTYGAIFGVILILEFVIMYTMDLNAQQGGMIGVVNALLNYIALPFVFILFAANHFKKLSGGYITFSQALKAGVTTTIIAAIVLGIFNIVFNLAVPEVQEKMMQTAKENMVKQNPNMTAEQLKMGIKVAEMMMKPYVMLPISIIVYALIGLINSLIVGAIVKKENPFGPFQPNDVNNIGAE